MAPPVGSQSKSGGPDAALPRITILTPCRNGVRYVAEAVESVVRQDYPAVEHLVLDACSTDGTLDVLARYPHLTVFSEPDLGSHDAMNKGLARASGEVIGLLNTDDFYPDNLLREVGRQFAANPDVDLVAGSCIYFMDADGGRRTILHVRKHRNSAGLWLPELMFGVVGINGCFFRRRAFERLGAFDNSYYIGADRHFMLRARVARLPHARIDTPAIWYRVHAGSSPFDPGMHNLLPIGEEHFRMAEEFSRATAGRPDWRRKFLAWHAFEGAKLVWRWTLRGQLGKALRVFGNLVRTNPLWPLRLLQALSMRRETRAQDRRDLEQA